MLINCSGLQDYTEEERLVVLPFNDTGFIITPSDFNESEWVRFRFGEGSKTWRTDNITYSESYITPDFRLHATEFVDLINDLSPVLIDSIITERSAERPPFDEIEYGDGLYFLMIDRVRNWMCVSESDEFDTFNFSMNIYENDENGLLYITMYGVKVIPYPASPNVFFSDDHHSLYEITLNELNSIIQFAEGLEKYSDRMHGHHYEPPGQVVHFSNLFLESEIFLAVVVSVGIIICVAIILVIRKIRKARTSIDYEENDSL